MTAPELKVSQEAQVRISSDYITETDPNNVNRQVPLLRNYELNVYKQTAAQIVAGDLNEHSSVPQNEIVCASHTYTLNATTTTQTAIIDASLHTKVANEKVFSYAIIEMGAGVGTVIYNTGTDELQMIDLMPHSTTIFPVTLGAGGRDIDMESTVASDTVKVTLISNLVDLGSNGDFIGTA